MDSSEQLLNAKLEKLSYAQRQRLAYIDFSLQYFGQISRQDLIKKFATGLAAATRDFASYRELAADNMQLVHRTKCYHRQTGFKPLFHHDPEVILHGLAKGFGDGLSHAVNPSDVCIDAVQLIHPDTNIIAALMRAIQQQQVLHVNYVSTSSGLKSREIVPHALVNNGQRWHVRAYDREHEQFSDFVVTRIQSCQNRAQQGGDHELQCHDEAWSNIVELILTPHPSLHHPEAIALDYQMHDGELKVSCRAALAAYILRQWSVDCSKGHRINSGVCQLALANIDILKKIAPLAIVPGAQ